MPWTAIISCSIGSAAKNTVATATSVQRLQNLMIILTQQLAQRMTSILNSSSMPMLHFLLTTWHEKIYNDRVKFWL